MNELEKSILFFKFDESRDKFKQVTDFQFEEIFDSSEIIIIVDHKNKTIWIWHGNYVDIRMKFIATQDAPRIRDRYGIDYKILAVEEDDESDVFKELYNIL